MKIAMLTIAVCLLAGCNQRDAVDKRDLIDPAELDGKRAFEEMRLLLDIPNRDSGTPGAKIAAEHIRNRLAGMGLDAKIDSFKDSTPRGIVEFHNVLATIPGEGEGLVLIGSHFDTKSGMPPDFQGANDSGSSTGLLIELGRVLNQSGKLPFDIELVFFDGEECLVQYGMNDGLHGSRHHANKLTESGRREDVRAVIILDMVGDRRLDISFPRNTAPELVKTAFAAARKTGLRSYFGLGESAVIDDHVPFRKAGMPAINFIDFNYGSQPGANDYWHTSEDTIDKVSPESLEKVGKVVLEMLNQSSVVKTEAGSPALL